MNRSSVRVPLCRLRRATTHKGSARQGLEADSRLQSIRAGSGRQGDSFSPSHA